MLYLEKSALEADIFGRPLLRYPDVQWAAYVIRFLVGEPSFNSGGFEKMVSRIGSSIVNAAGTPEMITKNLEEYEELAVKLAKNYLSPGAGAVSQLDKIRTVGEK